jgi:hypothetical protein
VAEDTRQIARFMRDVKSKLAREVNRLTGWEGHVFERRYDMAVVTEEEGAQIGRLAYILAHGVKEDLVERVRDWPGVQSARALLDGEPLTGHWFDRTREFAERNVGQPIEPLQFATVETVALSPVPCWAHLSKAAYRARVASLVESIEVEAALRRSQTGGSVLGVEAILAKDPQHRPANLARSPAPLLHAVSKAARRAFYEAYSFFVSAFRKAAEALKAGDRRALLSRAGARRRCVRTATQRGLDSRRSGHFDSLGDDFERSFFDLRTLPSRSRWHLFLACRSPSVPDISRASRP